MEVEFVCNVVIQVTCSSPVDLLVGDICLTPNTHTHTAVFNAPLKRYGRGSRNEIIAIWPDRLSICLRVCVCVCACYSRLRQPSTSSILLGRKLHNMMPIPFLVDVCNIIRFRILVAYFMFLFIPINSTNCQQTSCCGCFIGSGPVAVRCDPLLCVVLSSPRTAWI